MCPSCTTFTNLTTHQCYIQTYEQIQARRRECARVQAERRQARGGGRSIPSDPDAEYDDDALLVFFDIEAMQVDNTHVPNLVVAETNQSDTPLIWRGDTCIEQFLDQLDVWANVDPSADDDDDDDDDEEEDESDRRYSGITVIAHNFQGYDSYPIIQMYHQQVRAFQQTRNGGKVLELRVGKKIRFIDSMSFLPMALASFTKTFGLEDDALNLRKGFFPHFFNTPDHQTYVGPLPPQESYGPNAMSIQRKTEFDQWYEDLQRQHPPYVFDFGRELVEYCCSDVRLLKAGCLKFRDEFRSMAHFDPFTKMTIASACSWDLRRNRLEANTIASEPITGWRPYDQSLQCVDRVAHLDRAPIRSSSPTRAQRG